MRNWTIGKKLFAGTGSLALLITLSGWLGIWSSGTIHERLAASTADAGHLRIAEELQLAATEILGEEELAVLATVQKDRKKLEDARRQALERLAEAEKLCETIAAASEDENERKGARQIKSGLESWKNSFARLTANLEEGRLEEAERINSTETEPAINAIKKAAEEISTAQAATMQEHIKASEVNYSRNRAALIGAVGLALLVAVGVIWSVRQINSSLRQSAAELGEGAEQVAAAAGQVSTASQSLAQGASEQAASIEETSASSEEINSMARKNTENSHQAASLVSGSQQKFGEANQKLDQMVVAMGEINASSDKISKIIKTIDEIAFQTNILALNAAVEAARAGEAGMGFAVVADEVRNLAQRCAQAAKDTASLIEESIAKSNDGKVKVDQVAAVIRAITEESDRVKTLVDEVNLGSQEQARGIEQIAKAITQMEQVTQKNAANAEESASAAEELNAQSETLKDVVERLTAMLGGGGQAHTRQKRRALRRGNPRQTAPQVEHSGLAALSRAVSNKPDDGEKRSHEPVLAAANANKHALPLEDDFKEF